MRSNTLRVTQSVNVHPLDTIFVITYILYLYTIYLDHTHNNVTRENIQVRIIPPIFFWFVVCPSVCPTVCSATVVCPGFSSLTACFTVTRWASVSTVRGSCFLCVSWWTGTSRTRCLDNQTYLVLIYQNFSCWYFLKINNDIIWFYFVNITLWFSVNILVYKY